MAKRKKEKKKEPWLKWTNNSFSGSISILIGCYFCQSSYYGIMTGPTAGNKHSLIPCPLGHNKLPFTCIQIKYTRLVRQGDIKRKMLLQNGLILQGDGATVKGLCFSFHLIMAGKFFTWLCFWNVLSFSTWALWALQLNGKFLLLRKGGGGGAEKDLYKPVINPTTWKQ